MGTGAWIRGRESWLRESGGGSESVNGTAGGGSSSGRRSGAGRCVEGGTECVGYESGCERGSGKLLPRAGRSGSGKELS
ncbi:MAG: hypothetical protein Q4C47_00080 [Planctomycetia bacterium]|nr:hypothetical protein [Planctomycetia bacterium]